MGRETDVGNSRNQEDDFFTAMTRAIAGFKLLIIHNLVN